MTQESSAILRTATAEDCSQLVRLWGLVVEDPETTPEAPWRGHAREWFAQYVDSAGDARFPVLEVDGEIVATAIGTLENGVPNPHCPRGRTARLSNVITLPAHRSQGYGTTLVQDVIAWARAIGADRVDLSATPDGQRVYERLGFTLTSAPRMKLVLGQ
jgi:GNAT superfamily N-acetyltransferase